ncbi:MAG: type II toxin-antitoxin system VapC family toxin [Gemmatimonadetes bacterium]|nr:type II toxin-antitoxin system VapC family toxin [Gemmatimonadota bacterium]MYG35984.1 type II toxin-antitoxin system VapC family toxin [Gemmatimonadota bacterium]
MIFVDANVFMYFVGADHPLRAEALAFFTRARQSGTRLVTSAEVLQEILHNYLRRDRRWLLYAAFDLVGRTVDEVWPVEQADVEMARNLAVQHPGLEARDLVHLACCLRYKPEELMTFDRGLDAAWRVRRR